MCIIQNRSNKTNKIASFGYFFTSLYGLVYPILLANEISSMMFFVDPNSADPDADLAKQYQAAFAEQYFVRYVSVFGLLSLAFNERLLVKQHS